jgi:hypothetical protein
VTQALLVIQTCRAGQPLPDDLERVEADLAALLAVVGVVGRTA